MVRARVFGLRAHKGKTGQPKISGGYTFVEVMIVLAVSSLMFVAAMIAVGGQQNETGFTLAMQDLNSKIQNYVSQVKTSDGFDLSSYNCSPSSTNGYPVLNTPTDSGDCVYLGLAIQAVTGTSSIYTYNVIGNRTTYNGATNTGQLADMIDNSNPAPAADTNGNFVAVDTYRLSAGATVTKASLNSDKTNTYNLVGVYNALPDDVITSGTGAGGITLKAYPFHSTTGNVQSGSLRACIEETPASNCTSTAKPPLVDGQQWDMCMQSGDGKHIAQLSLTNSPNGLTSQLTFDSCAI